MRLKHVLFVVALMCAQSQLFSQAGTLDPSFGRSGVIIYTDTATLGNTESNIVAVQPDGKPVLARTVNSFQPASLSDNSRINQDMRIYRYNTDGTPDNSFGNGGQVTTDFGSPKDQVYDIAVQADGKILIAGGNGRFLLARYNSNGTPDNTFSEDGYLTTAFGGVNEYADHIVVQADGKIVTSGKAISGNNVFNVLVRYTADGSLDNSFNSNGKLVPDYGSALAVQPDGKIIIAGATRGNMPNLGLSRYNTNGTLDPSFDEDGRVENAGFGGYNNFENIIIQPDGKIIAVGVGAGSQFIIARYNINGSLDTGFEGGRIMIVPFNGLPAEGMDVGLQADGKILATGKVVVNGSRRAVTVRFLPNGVLDDSFGTFGKTISTFTNGDFGHSLAIFGNRIYVATNSEPGYGGALAAYRLDSNTPPASGPVNYKYYEGDFSVLPDFNALTPVKTGTTTNFDLSVRPAGKNDYFAVLYEGSIQFPAGGTYNFELASDDGSKLFVNKPYSFTGAPTVNNDGLNDGRSQYGSVSIPSAGVYTISLAYFEKTGGERIEVYYYGPGVERQRIPNSAFAAASETSPGLNYSYYRGEWQSLPDFNTLTPVQTGVSATTTPISATPDHYAMKWEGYIDIPAAGNWKFETVSDDGSKFYFNMPYFYGAAATVNNDGPHGQRSVVSNTINVPAAGKYPVVITYFDDYGNNDMMQVYWQSDNLPRQLVPNSAWSRNGPTTTQANNASSTATLSAESLTLSSSMKIYPNPSVGLVNIDFSNSNASNKVEAGIYDIYGKLLKNQSFGSLPAGRNILKMNLAGSGFTAGVYFIKLSVNGIPAKTMRVVRN